MFRGWILLLTTATTTTGINCQILLSTVAPPTPKDPPFFTQSASLRCLAGGMNRWMNGWMDGWLVGWWVGWMDGWMDGLAYTHLLLKTPNNNPSKSVVLTHNKSATF